MEKINECGCRASCCCQATINRKVGPKSPFVLMGFLFFVIMAALPNVASAFTAPWNNPAGWACQNGAHWVLAPAKGVTSATLYIAGTPYVMKKNGSTGSWAVDSVGVVTPTTQVYVTYFGGKNGYKVQLSHCICPATCPTSSEECKVNSCNEKTSRTGTCELTNRPNGTSCGSSSNEACDAPDTCQSGTCVDNKKSALAVCRASNGVCDTAEYCDGTTSVCPEDEFQDPGTVCNASTGVCDPAEVCTGSSASCPTNQYEPSSKICNAAKGACDLDEYCTGSSGACPTDQKVPQGTVCHAQDGACDVAEVCDGTNVDCPADQAAPQNTVCRAQSGECDVAEVCNGTTKECPADQFSPSTNECRSSTGVCDPAEFCTGSSATCPSNAFDPNTKVCNASKGACDPAEYCTGDSGPCPYDQLSGTDTICRASTGLCDPGENCTGNDVACPSDGRAPDGTLCELDDNRCTDDLCTGGVCTHPDIVSNECSLQGCTPGFWKNHTAAWDLASDQTVGDMPDTGCGAAGTDSCEFTTTTTFNSYFALTSAQSGFADSVTMLDAASAGGGGTSALARHGVSALLNIGANINYGLSDFVQLYTQIRNAYISGDAATIAALHQLLSGYNEQSHSNCPTGE